MVGIQKERLRQASNRRREQEKEQLRRAILEAATELLLEEGFSGLSLRRVAERIGYTPATIYLYFKDKDDLLLTLLDVAWIAFAAQQAAAIEGVADPLARLRALGLAYLQFGLGNPIYYQLMFMQRPDLLREPLPGELVPRVATLGTLVEAMQAGIDAGLLKPGNAEAYGDVAWSLTHGLVSLAIAMPWMMDEARIWRDAEVGFEVLIESLRLG